MNTRSITLIAIFAALAIVLNSIRIPTIYWPNMFYLLADIPIVVAFLLYGFKVGVLVEVLHIAGQLLFFPMGPAGIVTYPMGLLINLLMFSGIQLANKFMKSKVVSNSQFDQKKKISYFTGFAAVFRTGIMPIIDYGVLYHILLPIALSIVIPEVYVLALVPSFILYHVTTTLYVVPIAYLLAKRSSKYLQVKKSAFL